MSEIELKPCPFCGNKMHICTITIYDPYDGYQGNCSKYRIMCNNCAVEIKRDTKEEVIKAWNRRFDDAEKH